MRARCYGGCGSKAVALQQVQDFEQQIHKCAICRDTMRGVLVRLPSCNHIFHSQCISRLRRQTCPLCRKVFEHVQHGIISKPEATASVYIPGTCTTVTLRKVGRRDFQLAEEKMSSKRRALLESISQRTLDLSNKHSQNPRIDGNTELMPAASREWAASRRSRLEQLNLAHQQGHLKRLLVSSCASVPTTDSKVQVAKSKGTRRLFWEEAGYI
jgi:hypothetical protein